MKFSKKLIAAIATVASLSGHLYAQNVAVQDAWVRTSVPGQKASGAFMQITAQKATRLVSISTPIADVAEVHEMKMDGDVMRMRHVSGGLDLPTGQTVALAPGGYHIMLMGLKATLTKNSTVPLTLHFQDAQGATSTLELTVPVATVPPGAPTAPAAPSANTGHGAHTH